PVLPAVASKPHGPAGPAWQGTVSSRWARHGTRATSPCPRSPGPPMASIDAGRCADRTTDRRVHTRCTGVATRGSDSAIDVGAAGVPATGCMRGPDRWHVGSAAYRYHRAVARLTR